MTDTVRETVEEIRKSLSRRDETLAVAESCTGGLVSSRLTDYPGSSSFFERGYVVYSYGSQLELGVRRETLDEYGAVSKETARELAQSVRDSSGSTWGIAVTGITGPSGGTHDKPVGTVYTAVAYSGDWGTCDSFTSVRRDEYDGDRRQIKKKMAEGCLRHLLDEIEI
ncbi:CinA family protein [Halorutilales archaeon Cl-col2-1]